MNEPPRRGSHLAIGLATTVAMWAIGYVAMMSPGLVAGEALFALMVAAVLVGGFVAGKLSTAGGAGAGLKVGLICATANLLIVGSLFGGDTERSVAQQLAIWVGGLYLGSTIVAAIGGVLGGRGSRWQLRTSAITVFAVSTCAAIFLLLVTGGLVTGLEAGLAVPDWPNSFGHNMLLYPLAEMKGGIYYEHAHRLYGMLVGLSSITLLVLAFVQGSSRAVRTLAVVGFLMVVMQGILGGLRVTGHLTMSESAADMKPSVPLAVVHGVFGQLVFAVYCLIATMSSQRWLDSSSTKAESSKGRFASGLLVAILFVQLVTGALYRHYQIPVADAAPKHPAWAMHSHITWALVAFIATLLVGLKAMRMPREVKPMRLVGHLLLMLVGLQVAFGIAALVTVILRKSAVIPVPELVFTSLHQATGALLLGTSVMLAAWWRRLTAR